eukprot:11017487-Alexandrium_andersonii.AAC.1
MRQAALFAVASTKERAQADAPQLVLERHPAVLWDGRRRRSRGRGRPRAPGRRRALRGTGLPN